MQNRLKEFRNQSGLTLDEMSQKTGIKRGTLNNYENSKTEPKLDTWKQLADFFNVSIPVLQGIEMTHSDKVKEIGAVLFEKYLEHETYTDTDNNDFYIYDLNSFRKKLNKYCEDNSIQLAAREARLDHATINDYLDCEESFLDQLEYLINGITLRYEFAEYSGKTRNTVIVDDTGARTKGIDSDYALKVAEEYLEKENQYKENHELQKKESIGELQKQLENLNKSLKDRENGLKNNTWTDYDDNSILIAIKQLRKLTNHVLNNIESSL
ncbi:hypothetical protein [Lactobacillus plantarum] [Lactiplantibacillus mudanjiangensis]|uniref:helix-turn-helix domain-containing protein n=1 Tax=Lactiplantibacillus mudanjiangensis TaxID=1296538 RepID=UPI001014E359|nr:helix-turn-helix transcriptional regulator [Lactiplantibacillus mudanjiangensis]VDG31327.1 hypothetical protein [Lactobacillus plantarum] [Lactiplantibacillus mudanjiangensis]